MSESVLYVNTSIHTYNVTSLRYPKLGVVCTDLSVFVGRYPVSLFSHQLLLSIWRDPLFHVNAINPSVLNQADLHQCRVLRRRLSSAQKYVGTCRFAKQ